MSQVWFTSDLHLGHQFVASTRTHWVDRPSDWMGAVDWHDEFLAERWDSTVGNNDTVYVLGDICSGTDRSFVQALEWIDNRPGRKVLIHGNHDPINGMHRDAYKWNAAVGNVFHSNHAYLRMRVTLDLGARTSVMMSHFPYVDMYTGIGREGRYEMYRLQDTEGWPIVHGHTHSLQKLSWVPTLQLHVGVDAWRGSLVPLTWIQSEVLTWSRGIGSPERETGVQP